VNGKRASHSSHHPFKFFPDGGVLSVSLQTPLAPTVHTAHAMGPAPVPHVTAHAMGTVHAAVPVPDGMNIAMGVTAPTVHVVTPPVVAPGVPTVHRVAMPGLAMSKGDDEVGDWPHSFFFPQFFLLKMYLNQSCRWKTLTLKWNGQWRPTNSSTLNHLKCCLPVLVTAPNLPPPTFLGQQTL
jgi:hypothetical protein